MDNIQISKMTLKDIDEVLKIEDSHNISILSRNILESDLLNNNNYYIIAKYNDIIIGYIGISYVLDTADIISIVTLKKYTRKGIATQLLNAIFKFCNSKNISKIMLEVRSSNISAQVLYLKLGFTKISIRKNYYDGKEDAIIMEKKLQ